jgi:hypothetical protein
MIKPTDPRNRNGATYLGSIDIRAKRNIPQIAGTINRIEELIGLKDPTRYEPREI